MNIPAYLRRIRYDGSTTPTAETLRLLHRAHMQTVPFENLNISLGRRIDIDEEAFVRKIVEERRGGFCYELNGAFAALLRALGFQVTYLSGRVPTKDGSEAPEFDHLALRIDLDEPWLADVGFGDSFLEPLRLKTGIEQKQDTGIYRITGVGNSLSMERQSGGSWIKQYLFTLTPRQLRDFAEMCHFHQTSPTSPFTQKRVCSLPILHGRMTLSDLKFIVTENGVRQEHILNSEEEWRVFLKERFGVVL